MGKLNNVLRYSSYNSSNSSRSLNDPYLPSLPSLTHYLVTEPDLDPSKSSSSSSMFLSHSDVLRYASDKAISAAPTSSHLTSWLHPPPPPPGVDTSSAADSLVSPFKRPSDMLYHPTILGAHTTIGQTEAWYSINHLAKRARFESSSSLPIYPQRPGEKDCAHYMLTRTCKFGDSCKFDHPVWVPEGGIPDWKEVPLIDASEPLPERPGEPDCPYFLKTQRCKYGSKCKFNHPKDKLTLGVAENADASVLPERPSEPLCAFYMKTGKCKFGSTCKFNHPKDVRMLLTGQENGSGAETEFAVNIEGTTGDPSVLNTSASFSPAFFHNSKGLPIRLGEVDCPFYMKTGSCKYGATCRYNHPDRNAINPTAAALSHSIIASSAANLNFGIVNPAASIFQTIDSRLAEPVLGVGPTIYPQRPGQAECDYYMKTGECKFSERCRFHHPIDRAASMAKHAEQQEIKLSLAGLPRREGSVHCPYYMKTGTCKYGATCKFDHPPPGEIMAIAASHVTS